MTRINTNVSSLLAQNSLATSNNQLQTSLTRLSTGLRINSAADDPAGMVASASLGSDIANTQSAISNTTLAGEVIGTADSALGQVSSLLTDIQGLVTQAANTGTMSSAQISANQQQVDAALNALNTISQTTSFQGQNLLDGSLGFTTGSWTGQSNIQNLQINQANLGSTGTQAVDIEVNQAASTAELEAAVPTGVAGDKAVATFALATDGTNSPDAGFTVTAPQGGAAYNTGYYVNIINDANVATTAPTATYNAASQTVEVHVNDTNPTTIDSIVKAINDDTGFTAANTGATTPTTDVYDPTNHVTTDSQAFSGGTGTTGGLANNVTFELSGDKGSQVFSFTAGATLSQMITSINADTSSTGVVASANGGNTKLVLNSSDYGSAATVGLNVISETNAAGDAETAFTDGVTLSDGATQANHAAGTDVQATVNGIAATASGNAISVDNPALSLSANLAPSASSVKFNITGGGAMFQIGPDVVASQQARLGINSVDTGSLGGVDGYLYQLASGGTASLATNVGLAAKIVSEAQDNVTAQQSRLGAFQKETLDTNTASLNSALENLTAAQSNVSDADFAAETANLTRAQVLVQSGTTVLSIANKNPSNVLSLLQSAASI